MPTLIHGFATDRGGEMQDGGSSPGESSVPAALNGSVAAGQLPRRQAWWASRRATRFRRHKLALAGMCVLVFIGALGLLAPVIAPHGPYKADMKLKEAAPSPGYILGNDAIGRDNWARLVYATRVSLSVGIVAVAIQVVIGTTLGVVSGYCGGGVDFLLQRVTDVVMALPWILIIIVFVAMFGAGLRNVIVAIGVFGWTGVARIVRAEVLSMREREFVIAARCTGASDRRIILRHILPNVMAPLVVMASLGVAYAIITETSLSFLGLGVNPPTPSWGNMIHQAQSLRILEEKPWIWVPPGVLIAVTVLSINFIGDGLRDALDPRADV